MQSFLSFDSPPLTLNFPLYSRHVGCLQVDGLERFFPPHLYAPRMLEGLREDEKQTLLLFKNFKHSPSIRASIVENDPSPMRILR